MFSLNIGNIAMKQSGWRRGAATLLAGAAIFGLSAQPASAAQSKSWVISWFSLASYSKEGDCPGGVNVQQTEQFRNDLKLTEMAPDKIEAALQTGVVDGSPEIPYLIAYRGRIDGKPVNAYAHPASAADPKLHTLVSPFAYGFNLDGKGVTPASFEDPETHEKGVNNQLYRALGCIQSHRALIPERPTWWAWMWGELHDSLPGMLITVTGEDLSKDGDVTIEVGKSLDHVLADVRGNTGPDATFRLDPNPVAHNSFKGKIQNGVISITEPAKFHLPGDPLFFTALDFTNTHLRLNMKPDGSLTGILGGYQPWLPIYSTFGLDGFTMEANFGVDTIGVYYALKHMADADPDPKTGQNRAISTGYYVEAVPAFVTQPLPNAKTAQAGN